MRSLFRLLGRPVIAVAVLASLMGLVGSTPATAADPPTIMDVSPSSGTVDGGTSVTLTGSGFAAGATVAFNGAAATDVVVVNATSITATTPPGTVGSATVVVTNTDGLGSSVAGAFTYLGPPPAVNSVTPSAGTVSGGTAVTITGSGFQAGASVRFGGTLATGVTLVNGTTITAITPIGSVGAVNVQVTNPDSQSGTLSGGFTYQPLPTPSITSVSPASGTTGGGTTVTITGSGFAQGATVRFGNANGTGVEVISATQVRAVTPAGAAGTVAVRVTNIDNQQAQMNSAYTYVSTPAPTVSAVSPSSGTRTGGNTVIVTGTNFLPGAVVAFDGVNATSTTIVSSIQATAVVPSSATTGAVTVRVTNTDGKSGTKTGAYTYTGTMTVTSVSPSTGTTGGGTPVSITGSGFLAGATVRFGTSDATSVVVQNSTLITAVTPARGTGTVNVEVRNPGGEVASRTSAYTYVNTGSPTVASVTPSGGPLSGGNTVTVIGSGFNPGAAVTFGGRSATGIVVVDSTWLTAVVPSGTSVGAVTVRVTNTDGRDGSRSSAYTYLSAPTVTSVTPSSGSTAGGTEVTIRGSNFVSGMSVLFGDTPGTNVTVTNSTTLTARTPARATPGMVAVIVLTPAGQASTNNAFTYRQPAVITGLSPNSGPTAGGTLITITGSGFTSGSTVTLGGTAATSVTLVSASQLTARTPARPSGSVDVQVRDVTGVLAVGTPTFVYQSLPGSIVGGELPRFGVSLFVFGGGTTAQLTDLAVAGGCSLSRLSFWSTQGGRFLSFVPSAPAFTNVGWNTRFPNGIPSNTPLLGACR